MNDDLPADAITAAIHGATEDPAVAAGMAGLNEHFHAEHDDGDSVEECCVSAVLSAAGFIDTFEAYEAGRAQAAAAEAVHQFRCPDAEPDTPCLAGPVEADFGYARAALEAAAPAIREQAIAETLARVEQGIADGAAEVMAQAVVAERQALIQALLDGDPSPAEAAFRRFVDDEEAADCALALRDLLHEVKP